MLDRLRKKVLQYVTNSCYNRIKNRRIRMINMGEEKGIFNAVDLAAYIAKKYHEEYSNGRFEISPIKLQKSLYFCFAMWGGLIRKAKKNPEFVEENLTEQKEILFDDEIEAWVYGPVIPNVYNAHKENKLGDSIIVEKEFEKNSFLKETINSILDDLFEVADFKLVSISHEDKCWSNNFDSDDMYHNYIIDKDLIISEYANKQHI